MLHIIHQRSGAEGFEHHYFYLPGGAKVLSLPSLLVTTHIIKKPFLYFNLENSLKQIMPFTF